MRLLEAGGLAALAFVSGVTAKLDSVVVGGVATSALAAFGTGLGQVFSATCLSGRAS